MKRRTFVKDSSLTAFSVAAFGTIQWSGRSFVGDSVTTTDILGPFYRPGSPMRSNLIPTGSSGQVLRLEGTVYQADGATPLTDALIESWQCDEHELYDNTSDDYRYRGAQRTGSDGKYAFKTIIPVPYRDGEGWRPSHIHLRVSSNDHQDLITQIYFKGDPHIAADASANAPESVNRILNITKNSENESVVRFDIVMGKPFLLSDAGYRKVTGLYQCDNGMVEFIRQDDLLFVKWNGQYMEGMQYKGENTFAGGMNANHVKFEILENGDVTCKLTIWDFPSDKRFLEVLEGIKVLKYGD